MITSCSSKNFYTNKEGTKKQKQLMKRRKQVQSKIKTVTTIALEVCKPDISMENEENYVCKIAWLELENLIADLSNIQEDLKHK